MQHSLVNNCLKLEPTEGVKINKTKWKERIVECVVLMTEYPNTL